MARLGTNGMAKAYATMAFQCVAQAGRALGVRIIPAKHSLRESGEREARRSSSGVLRSGFPLKRERKRLKRK